jgi:hypothetical protein
MRIRSTGILLLFLCSSLAFGQTGGGKNEIRVTGRLTRAMAIGGESTGWTLELDPEVNIQGTEHHSLEISYSKTAKLEKLANKMVVAKGTLTTQPGVERGERTIFKVASIKEAKPKADTQPSAEPPSQY